MSSNRSFTTTPPTSVSITGKAWWRHLGETLKFAFYVCIHPLDGFWDLTNEKRGSIAAANIIVAASLLVGVLTLTLTNFQFIIINMEYFNVIYVFMNILLPIFLWTLANWSLTTLMDGKGRMRDIYMAVAYAMLPSVIINAFMIILSQVITYDERAFYYFLDALSIGWTALLIICGMMMIHDYSLAKTLFSCFLTIIGIGVIIFIFIVFFSLISDAIAYFISLYREIVFRVM
ncbi:MAG: YIP1 family protein [Treponema sp.]|nr:YIP1 family protein [Treponema sp.]